MKGRRRKQGSYLFCWANGFVEENSCPTYLITFVNDYKLTEYFKFENSLGFPLSNSATKNTLFSFLTWPTLTDPRTLQSLCHLVVIPRKFLFFNTPVESPYLHRGSKNGLINQSLLFNHQGTMENTKIYQCSHQSVLSSTGGIPKGYLKLLIT